MYVQLITSLPTNDKGGKTFSLILYGYVSVGSIWLVRCQHGWHSIAQALDPLALAYFWYMLEDKTNNLSVVVPTKGRGTS